MSKLDARDRRRAFKIAAQFGGDAWARANDNLPRQIAAALRREREETGFGAMKWFLFSDKNERAKAKRALTKKAASR